MTIEEVQDAKLELQEEMKSMIAVFEKKTGLSVLEVRIPMSDRTLFSISTKNPF